MTTAFQRRRGEASGRIAPNEMTPSAGTKIFVLGAEDSETEILSDGDFVEVSQSVDLTGVDVIRPSVQTVGVVMQSFTYPTTLQLLSDTLALWSMDEDGVDALNSKFPGADLSAAGSVSASTENYSAGGTSCRRIPPSTGDSRLEGENNPVIWSSPLSEYTFEAWVKFEASAHGGDSTGVNPTLFECVTAAGGGLRIYLAGETAGNKWNVAVQHTNGGSTASQLFTVWEITADIDWTLITVVFDDAESGGAKLKLYIDGVFEGNAPAAITAQPGPADLDEDVYVADSDLVGYIDQVRLSDTAHDASTVLADYERCVDDAVSNSSEWVMSILVDGTVYGQRTIAAGEAKTLYDFRAPVRHLTGDHTVAFRMTLNEVT